MSAEPRGLSVAVPTVALVGNPNTGKTTLFNRLTGQRARVGNYPGVTVERRWGSARLNRGEAVELLDVPGCYSLAARSSEEAVAIGALLGLDGQRPPDLVVLVVDATQLVRNLYLAVQLRELGLRCVLALNMVDELDDGPPRCDVISADLGVPCVPIVARTGQGVDALKDAVAATLDQPAPPPLHIQYSDALEASLSAVSAALPSAWRDGAAARGLALWALSSVDQDDELPLVDAGLRLVVRAVHAEDVDVDVDIAASRYRWLDVRAERWQPPPRPSRVRLFTDRVDAVLVHPVWGFLAFLVVMGAMFQALFTWSDPLIGLVEQLFGWIGGTLAAVLPPGLLTDLLLEGVVAGVGSVVVFLPQILLLFLFIGVMEDSGYMSRAAFLMDRIMRSLGLNGQAFVPMLSGFACAVPAVMATRTMARQRDRLLTMMVVPLMTCSARLPVYTLIIAALFPPASGGLPVQGLLMVGMYLFSTVVALIALAVLGRTVFKGPHVPLLLELPPYRLPQPATVVRMMVDRAGLFLREAGTVILVCTVILWGLLTFPRAPEAPADAPPPVVAELQADALANSWGGQLGRAIEPAIAPLGFDWKMGVGVIGAFAAREVFVSTMGVVYGVGGDADEQSTTLRERMRAEVRADGSPVYTPLVGMSLMVFFALACQCISTVAVVKRESGGWRWPVFMVVYMTALAWVASFVVYQGGRLLGLG